VDFSSMTPLTGGWSGETFLAEAAGERSVVRIYASGSRGPTAPEVDAAVLRLVRGLVPVPEVLEVHRGEPDADRPGLLVTSFLPGVRGDELLTTLGPEGLARVGAILGGLLADLGGMPTTRSGPFLDAELRIGDFGVDGLPDYLEQRLPGLGHLTPDEIEGLRETAVVAQTLLDSVTRTCLVHSDLNPKNLLLDPGTLALTAVLDWEFAHAGCTATDLGNLLRFDRDPVFVDAVLTAYRARMPAVECGPELLTRARSADLWALVDLAARRHSNPVAARADAHLRAIARARDVHALP
jgi:aminoglycoside phosphotransferase (APT) family kinase protein